VAILLALAAVMAAIAGTRASFTASSAGDARQSAVREQVKRAAATVENVRYVYFAQAPVAFRASIHGVLADELEVDLRRVSGSVRSLLAVEASAQRQTAEALREGIEAAVGSEFRSGDGYDLARFLASEEAQYPDLLALDPDGWQARGDDLGRRAAFEVGVTIPVAVAFLFGALGQGFVRRRRLFLGIGTFFLIASVGLAVAVEVML
jgi:hypothetical protein